MRVGSPAVATRAPEAGADAAAARPPPRARAAAPAAAPQLFPRALAAATAAALAALGGAALSGLLGPAGADVMIVVLALIVAALGGIVAILARDLRRVAAGLEGARFEVQGGLARIQGLRAEIAMLREVVGSLSARAEPRAPRGPALEFGTLGGRPCAKLGDGSFIVETLVGYRRFETQDDAEAFVGAGGFRPLAG